MSDWKSGVAMLLLLGCGAARKPVSAPRATKTEAAAPPKGESVFRAMLQRESSPQQKHPVDVLGGLLRFSIEASEAPEVKATSTTLAQAAAQLKMKGFGEDSLVCNMVGDTLEVGAVMRNLTQTLQFTQRPTLDVGHQGAYGTLHIEGPYVSKANPTQGGTFKMAALFGDRVSLLCAEGSAGYSKTFRRVMQGVFETVQISSDGTDGKKGIFSEVARVTVGGQPVGLGITHVNREGDGYLSREYAFMLFATGDRWGARSLVEETLYDAKGRLERKALRDVNMGAVESGVEFQRKGPQSFAYHRTYNGKEASGVIELKAPTAPLNHSTINNEIRKRGKDFKYTSLSGGEDLTVVYTVSKHGEGLQRSKADGKGSPDTIELDAEGRATKIKDEHLEMEFIARHGELPTL